MLVCATDAEQLDLPSTDGESLDEMTASKRKELCKKFFWNHGRKLIHNNSEKNGNVPDICWRSPCAIKNIEASAFVVQQCCYMYMYVHVCVRVDLSLHVYPT